MLGGTMFGLLTVLVPLLPSGGPPGLAAGNSMLLFALLFLIPGTVGLYVAQRPVLSWPGKLACATLLAGLSLVVLLGAVSFAGVTVPPVVQLFAIAPFVGGSMALGVVVVRRNVLVHARLGGGLLALSLPFWVVVQALLAQLQVDAAWPGILLFAGPFSLAWVLLGLDLLTVDSGGVDLTVIRQPD